MNMDDEQYFKAKAHNDDAPNWMLELGATSPTHAEWQEEKNWGHEPEHVLVLGEFHDGHYDIEHHRIRPQKYWNEEEQRYKEIKFDNCCWYLLGIRMFTPMGLSKAEVERILERLQPKATSATRGTSDRNKA